MATLYVYYITSIREKENALIKPHFYGQYVPMISREDVG